MPKPRTKRGAIREERKRKRRDENNANFEAKRRRREEDGDAEDETHDGTPQDDWAGQDDGYAQFEGELGGNGGNPPVEKEFFGMLSEEEQEYFRRSDEMLELNQFPSAEDRTLFLNSVLDEARGKELKLASSQSCSRLMERLIQLSSTAQRKRLFAAFAGHFLSLVQHRFASHCCEALFLHSAGAVGSELAGFVIDTKGADADEGPEASMEHLYLETLDELEGHLSYLITDRFASHTLRVLLVVLSGRPLDDLAVKALVKSKKKENISVVGAAAVDESNQGLRAVPSSFTSAVHKIIEDSVSGLDATSLRVLAKHPIGNPTLQLLLELDLGLNKSEQKKSDASPQPTLLYRLLPGAPQTLADESSEASEFVNGMVYDQIGSRLVETLVTHAPGRVFKALNHNIFLPRIQGYVRNDISCYPAIRVLARLGKDDLVRAVAQIEPTVPQLVGKARFNVLRTLFERCVARGLSDEIKRLNRGLKEGCGPHPSDLVKTLCRLDDDDDEAKKKKKSNVTQLARNEYAIQSHGAQLLTTLLSIPGPSKGVQEALLALPADQLLRLAQASLPTVTVLSTALSTPSPNNPAFHKVLTSTLIMPHAAELANSQFGHNLIVALASVPSKGRDRSVPFHMKEAVMDRLGAVEPELRASWMGRSVWRGWKGDAWKTKRGDWKVWMREVDIVEQEPKPEARKPARKPAIELEEEIPSNGDAADKVEDGEAGPHESAGKADGPDEEEVADVEPAEDKGEKKEKKMKKSKEEKERKRERKKEKEERREKKEKKGKKGKKEKKAEGE